MLNLILLILPTIKETAQKMENGPGKVDFYGASINIDSTRLD